VSKYTRRFKWGVGDVVVVGEAFTAVEKNQRGMHAINT
jgi:hypothetical protein